LVAVDRPPGEGGGPGRTDDEPAVEGADEQPPEPETRHDKGRGEPDEQHERLHPPTLAAGEEPIPQDADGGVVGHEGREGEEPERRRRRGGQVWDRRADHLVAVTSEVVKRVRGLQSDYDGGVEADHRRQATWEATAIAGEGERKEEVTNRDEQTQRRVCRKREDGERPRRREQFRDDEQPDHRMRKQGDDEQPSRQVEGVRPQPYGHRSHENTCQ